MKTKFLTASGAVWGVFAATPALAHEPAAVDGGVAAWIMHMLTQPDHMIAIMAAVALGVGLFVRSRAKSRAKSD